MISTPPADLIEGSLQQELLRLRLEDSAKVQTEVLRADIAHVDARISDKTQRKIEEMSIVARRQSLDTRTDCGLPLRRFFEESPPLDHPWSEFGDVQDILTQDGM